MDKIISFGKGIRRQPSIGEDGELSELVNLVPQNGELVNVRDMAKADAPTITAGTLLGVHKVFDGDNYIVSQGYILGQAKLVYYSKKDGSWNMVLIGSVVSPELPKVIFVGNTMVVLGTSSTYYYLWKDGEYVSLGNEIPELNLSFGLKTYAEWKTHTYLDSDFIIYITDNKKEFGNGNDPNGAIEDSLKDMFIGNIYELKNELLEKNRFIWPFFVRYAYRMYDGTLVKHSSPVLMVCATDVNPVILFGAYYGAEHSGNMYKGLGYHLMAASHTLDYAMANNVDLSNWKDIIQSVDIFISPQFTTIDSNGDIPKGFVKWDDYRSKSFSYGLFRDDDVTGRYCRTSNLDIIEYSNKKYNFDTGNYEYEYVSDDLNSRFILRLPFNKNLHTEIKNASLFYKVASINIDELSTKRVDVPISEGVLSSLEGREVMTDDFSSHDYVTGKDVYVYNSRLNLIGITKTLYDGAPFYTLFPYVNGMFDAANSSNEDILYHVYIRDAGRDIVVGGEINKSNFSEYAENGCLYFYYPNPKAYKVVITRLGDSYSSDLKPHDTLNGAYAYADMVELFPSPADSPNRSNEPTHYANDIYTTLVNNPFVFAPSGINRIGDGELLGLSTAAKALSQGQFGQFPLYAFCTDGIWALEVASDGSYSAKQPISRDVCNNPDSITQIDGAVVFTTDQGLKLIQGSEVVLLSGQMDGHNVNESDYFPNDFFKSYNAEDYDALVVQETRDFREILAHCKIAYDYPNQLLRIFPERTDINAPYKYYVYSFNSREFASVIGSGTVHSIVAGYPASLVQIGYEIYTFDAAISTTPKKGILLTRPIDMGEPFAMKKLHDMRMHYTKHADESKCKMVVYVSNDGVKWFVLPSLRKRSFKYYRIAVITNLTDADRLSGLMMRYEVERNNKMR